MYLPNAQLFIMTNTSYLICENINCGLLNLLFVVLNGGVVESKK